MSKEPAPATPPLLRHATAIGFIERYLLSALFLWLAWRELEVLREMLSAWPRGDGIWSVRFVVYVREFSLFLVQLLIGALLLITRRPAQAPRRLAELLVPLAMSLFFLAYSLAARATGAAAGQRSSIGRADSLRGGSARQRTLRRADRSLGRCLSRPFLWHLRLRAGDCSPRTL